MKFLFEEQDHIDYEHYKFPYCIYGIKDISDSYTELYEKGFLPYTNNLEEEKEIYYLCRSVRIQLEDHKFKSKQKNILNKTAKFFADEKLAFELLDKNDLIHDSSFREWSIKNAAHGFLKEERLDYILSRPYLKQILKISHDGVTLAYLYIVHDQSNFIHVWYSFYDLEISHNDFGKWIFLKTIAWAQKQGYQYFYVGTCYSLSALYKLSLSPATYYFNGGHWDDNISPLKHKLLNEKK